SLVILSFPTRRSSDLASMLSYTLVGFFISFALGMLFIGPLSDKLGRKTILIAGVLVYGLFSFCCSFAQNIEQLILFRILQAIGRSEEHTSELQSRENL